jgi:hypothetical protein
MEKHPFYRPARAGAEEFPNPKKKIKNQKAKIKNQK